MLWSLQSCLNVNRIRFSDCKTKPGATFHCSKAVGRFDEFSVLQLGLRCFHLNCLREIKTETNLAVTMTMRDIWDVEEISSDIVFLWNEGDVIQTSSLHHSIARHNHYKTFKLRAVIERAQLNYVQCFIKDSTIRMMMNIQNNSWSRAEIFPALLHKDSELNLLWLLSNNKLLNHYKHVSFNS